MLYQLSYSRSNRCPPKQLEWGGEDLNLCRHTPADLQSAPFGRSGTSPQLTAGTYPIPPPPVKPYRTETSLVLRRLWMASRRGGIHPGQGSVTLPWMHQEAISVSDRDRPTSTEHKRAGEGTRTPNRLITNEMLYQLSYASLCLCRRNLPRRSRPDQARPDPAIAVDAELEAPLSTWDLPRIQSAILPFVRETTLARCLARRDGFLTSGKSHPKRFRVLRPDILRFNPP
jgi:hypothetical protein